MSVMTSAPTSATGKPLRAFKRNVHSQFGEDGIIEEILRRLELWDQASGSLFCVEFGAWDGIHLSNTRRLIEERGARAVLIEGDRKRARELVRNCADFDGVQCVHRMVEWTGPHSLSALLALHECPRAFDVLSIDVDGQDYWIWRHFSGFEPKIVVIEYNPTAPYKHPYIPPYDRNEHHGCSLGALVELGTTKGYQLAAVTDVNAVFVRDDLLPRLGLDDNSIDALTEGLTDFRSSVVQTSKGELILIGNQMLMWHQSVIDRQRIQTLPGWLRRHPDSYGLVRRKALGLYQRLFSSRLDRRIARSKERRSRMVEELGEMRAD